MVLFLGRCNLVCFGMGMVCLKGDKEPDTSTFPDMVTELLYSARIFSLMKEGTNRKKKHLCQECTLKPACSCFCCEGKRGHCIYKHVFICRKTIAYTKSQWLVGEPENSNTEMMTTAPSSIITRLHLMLDLFC